MNFTYTATGRQTAVIDALSHRTVNVYDAAGRLTSVTNPPTGGLGHVTRYELGLRTRPRGQVYSLFILLDAVQTGPVQTGVTSVAAQRTVTRRFAELVHKDIKGSVLEK